RPHPREHDGLEVGEVGGPAFLVADPTRDLPAAPAALDPAGVVGGLLGRVIRQRLPQRRHAPTSPPYRCPHGSAAPWPQSSDRPSRQQCPPWPWWLLVKHGQAFSLLITHSSLLSCSGRGSGVGRWSGCWPFARSTAARAWARW